MSDHTRHTVNTVTPLGESLMWLTWRVCAVPAAILRALVACGRHASVAVAELGAASRAHLARRPDIAYVALVAGLLMFAVLTGLATGPVS